MAFLDYNGLTRFKTKLVGWVTGITGNEDMKTQATTITGAVAELYDNKAAKSNALALTATASGWTGNSEPYTQTITATGVTSSVNIELGVGGSLTSEQLDAILAAKIVCTAKGTNSVTLSAYGEKPTVDLPFAVFILG